MNVIAGFLAVVFAAAAVRGAASAPALAAGMGVLFVATVIGWILWRRSPLRALTITPEEITYGRPDRVAERIPRTSAPLRFRRSAVRQTGWWLSGENGPGAVSMIGFDLDTVRSACVQHGWEFR